MVVFMGKQQDKLTGRFIRQRYHPWTPQKWNDGYLDNKNRFRVYRPDYPRSYSNGYALRAHVVWWLHHGRCHARNKELHHKDGTTTNDAITNLKPLSNSNHQKFHHPTKYTDLICLKCNHPFRIEEWRVRSRPTKFCSPECYHSYPRSEESKRKASESMKKWFK